MTSKRRYKYLRALRHILVASLMMASFYVGRWSMSWRLVDLFATVLYVWVVVLYFRSELREHRRDSQQFREFLRECEKVAPGIWPPPGPLPAHPIVFPPNPIASDAEVDAMDKAYGYKSYRCPKCGRLSHLPAEVEPYCIECLAEASL